MPNRRVFWQRRRMFLNFTSTLPPVYETILLRWALCHFLLHVDRPRNHSDISFKLRPRIRWFPWLRQNSHLPSVSVLNYRLCCCLLFQMFTFTNGKVSHSPHFTKYWSFGTKWSLKIAGTHFKTFKNLKKKHWFVFSSKRGECTYIFMFGRVPHWSIF